MRQRAARGDARVVGATVRTSSAISSLETLKHASARTHDAKISAYLSARCATSEPGKKFFFFFLCRRRVLSRPGAGDTMSRGTVG